MKGIGAEIQRLVQAARCSMAGLRSAFSSEAAFRLEVLVSLPLIIVAIVVADNALELAILLIALALVWITELLNTAIETAVDRIGPESHLLSGKAKDIGSAAVFVASVVAGLVWLLVLTDGSG
ncbi:diacylglycerol kinase [Spiribacter salinus M19-40]|jgi:diacylglycerol kinase (ATP)|uniref:Diacylglycerol kinase n=2 Tax=Spiribacter salinus TaxID=1335746 RepID=R4V4D6_9GAMM|nr:diacylglycerol kinase [Spiribacter salinus]AGM40804.1 diacylglycerol kinase [Spiribacter salinus M19-40]MBY5268031.1 diacylglycerol kinase [Spiribacter salinus]TQF00531.1 MAG: diacylglycerol kinase [Spiribacter salinus]